jgi:catechol 2,3-dioxygenase-like lactoylglutathione lyase family enzyme
VVRSYADALAWLGRFCGCRALEYTDNDDPLVARKGGVTWIGDNGLELMEPKDPEAGPGRFLKRFGPGVYALALQVEDVHAAARWLETRGAGIVGDPARGFIFTRPQHTCSVYLEWADARWEFDPRFGAELPAPTTPPLIDVPRIAYWGALAADPRETLLRLRELWPASVLLERPAADPATPAAALSVEDGVLALYPMPGDAAQMGRLWGLQVFKPRLHVIGLRVRDLAAAERCLRAESVRILRGSAAQGELVTHPDDTCGIPLAWTDRDLPGDPRGPLQAA